MKESWKYMFGVYAPMFGVPVLLLILTLATYLSLTFITLAISALISLGFLFFGIIGARDVFIAVKHGKNKLKIGTVVKTERSEIKTPPEGSEIVRFKIKRFNNKTKSLDEQAYDVEVDKFSNVLDGLLSIKAKDDPTLSMRYSCRMGICGSCGMVVNGKPVLACETNVFENLKGDSLEISPMLGHPLLKDLVTDFDDFFERHILSNPSIFRKDTKEKYNPESAYSQTKVELDKFLPFSYCIMCGLCVDACPVININPAYLGPQALSQVYRYYADSRDQLGVKRLEMVDNITGVWDCEFSGSCSDVCPKGVDPALAIQLLKVAIVKNDVSLKK